MKYLFYILGAVFFIIWFILYMVLNIGNWVHLFFILSFSCVVVEVTKGNKKV